MHLCEKTLPKSNYNFLAKGTWGLIIIEQLLLISILSSILTTKSFSFWNKNSSREYTQTAADCIKCSVDASKTRYLKQQNGIIGFVAYVVWCKV